MYASIELASFCAKKVVATSLPKPISAFWSGIFVCAKEVSWTPFIYSWNLFDSVAFVVSIKKK